MSFQGFPKGTTHIPVPSPLMGAMLQKINNLEELKCILRVVWLLNQKKGHPRFLTVEEVLADKMLASSLKYDESSTTEELKRTLLKLVKHDILLCTMSKLNGTIRQLYMLNSEQGRKSLEDINNGRVPAITQLENPDQIPAENHLKSNIFALYEENVGILTPIMVESLKDAENSYPWPWIEEAFQLAIGRNIRNWLYISRILERWTTEGKDSGEFGRHTTKIDRTKHFKEYLEKRKTQP